MMSSRESSRSEPSVTIAEKHSPLQNLGVSRASEDKGTSKPAAPEIQHIVKEKK